MPAQVNITSIIQAPGALIATFNVVLSGSYPGAGGDPLNFTGNGTLPVGVDPQFVGLVPAIEGSSILNIDVWSGGGGSISAANQTGYDAACTRTGTPSIINPQTGVKLKVQALATPSTPAEHAAGAYESQYTGDLIMGMVVFSHLI